MRGRPCSVEPVSEAAGASGNRLMISPAPGASKAAIAEPLKLGQLLPDLLLLRLIGNAVIRSTVLAATQITTRRAATNPPQLQQSRMCRHQTSQIPIVWDYLIRKRSEGEGAHSVSEPTVKNADSPCR
jgi:hypothetical protein